MDQEKKNQKKKKADDLSNVFHKAMINEKYCSFEIYKPNGYAECYYGKIVSFTLIPSAARQDYLLALVINLNSGKDVHLQVTEVINANFRDMKLFVLRGGESSAAEISIYTGRDQ